LLYRRLAPWLTEQALSRTVTAWVIGEPEDVSSIARTVAARAAHTADRCGQMEMRLYATIPGKGDGKPPAESPAQRWPELDVELRTGEPEEQVDLVALRCDGSGSRRWRRAWECLRPGGRLLVDGEPPETEGMVCVGRSGLLYEKSGSSRESLDAERKRLQERLVNDHMALARSLARRFEGRGEPANELRQVALAALVSCAQRFDPSRGVAFSSYATGSILGELKRHFRDRAWGMRVGRSTQETYLEVNRARETLSQVNKRSPTIAEIAQEIGTSEERVLEAMDAERGYWLASLDAPRDETGEGIELASIDEGFERVLNRHQLELLLPELPRRERVILERRFFRGWTQERIAREVGVSQMQVSRLLAKTLSDLRGGFARS
jgi:RNA polymerase sigma-B factor